MSVKSLVAWTLFCAICFTTSCGRKAAGPKIAKAPVVKVSGEVTVDGKAEAGIRVRCIPQGQFAYSKELAETVNTFRAITDENGKFSMQTYEAGDGLPPGEYGITFIWPAADEGMRKRDTKQLRAADRLGQKYDVVRETSLRFKVTEGEPLELELFKLVTK